MPKFSGRVTRPNVISPMRTTGVVGSTYEGGIGYERDAKTELFLLAITNMVSEDTFYESARDRDERFRTLIHTVVAEDPEWIRGFIPYLRNVMQMRSASIVMAAEYVAAKGENSRGVVSSAMSRADEPAEILAYWAQTHGKNFPMPLKRGVADALEWLYTERAALKYDGKSRAWRMGDVIELTHPKPLTAEQSALYKYLLDTRRNREEIPLDGDNLPIITDYRVAMNIAPESRRDYLRERGSIPKGMTWESLSGWLQGPMDAEAWEAVIPQMGYMALLRNLRNFEDANISDEMMSFVMDKLEDPEEVAKSRQFPIRFYSAWKATDSLTWGTALEKALDYAVENVPQLEGDTLILVDVSGSMSASMSQRTQVQRWEIAAVFGAALAKKNRGHSKLVVFQSYSQPVAPARSILQTVDRIRGFVGGGTDTWQALNTHYSSEDRVVIITDEQAHHGRPLSTPIPAYTFNVAGYKMAHSAQGSNGQYVFGGLTDAGFVLLKAIDSLEHGRWPWA